MTDREYVLSIYPHAEIKNTDDSVYIAICNQCNHEVILIDILTGLCRDNEHAWYQAKQTILQRMVEKLES